MEKRVFSFPHLFSSLDVLNLHYLERPGLIINLDFYLNSTLTERRLVFFPQRLTRLELEHCCSCGGDFFYLMSVCQSFFIKFPLKIHSKHDLWTAWLNVLMYLNCYVFFSLLYVVRFLWVNSSTESSRARMEFTMLKKPKTYNKMFF